MCVCVIIILGMCGQVTQFVVSNFYYVYLFYSGLAYRPEIRYAIPYCNAVYKLLL